MSRQTYTTDLTDAQWKKLEPLLPPPSQHGRPREHSLREIVGATHIKMEDHFLNIMAFSPDGRYLLTGGVTQLLQVWETPH